MKREDIKAMLPILQAFADGKVIQMLDNRSIWTDLTEVEGLPIGTLREEPNSFRIKPESKYRPFENAEECWQEIQKHKPFGWIKPKDDDTISKFMLIDSLMDEVVTVRINVRFNYHELLEHYTFADCTPFGVKLEE